MPETRGTADDRTPDYYRGQGGLQPFDVINAFDLGFYDGSAVKYVCRWQEKDGIKDLRKARHLLDELIRLEEARAPEPGAVTVAIAEPYVPPASPL